MSVGTASACYVCGESDLAKIFTYESPPEGEVRFKFSNSKLYHREIVKCSRCGHFLSRHSMDMEGLYSGEYVTSTYGKGGLRRAFERITSLDPSKSDNTGRVERILECAARQGGFFRRVGHAPTVLDVGSGLCVFLNGMKKAGWDCTALDPDPRAVEHAQRVVGVTALRGEFPEVKGLGRFDLVTFNKVLEHVKDPITMLRLAKDHLNPAGFVYIEVPDGDGAMVDGSGREEFWIDHWHVFSSASLALLIASSGFCLRRLERIREPSGKYTLWGVMTF